MYSPPTISTSVLHLQMERTSLNDYTKPFVDLFINLKQIFFSGMWLPLSCQISLFTSYDICGRLQCDYSLLPSTVLVTQSNLCTVAYNNLFKLLFVNLFLRNRNLLYILKRPIRLFLIIQIFNYLVERAQDGSLLFPLRADVEEAERIAELICQTVGLPVPKNKTLQRTGSTDINDDTFLLNFSEFVRLILQRVSSQDDFAVVSQGIAEVYEQIVSDIVRKVFKILMSLISCIIIYQVLIGL